MDWSLFALQSLCREIKQRRRGVASILRLCQHLLDDRETCNLNADHQPMQLIIVNLERRWEAIVMQAVQCDFHSCCTVVHSVAAVPRLWSTGSVIVGQGLSSSMVCGIFPGQESNPCLLHWQVDSLPLNHQGSPES